MEVISLLELVRLGFLGFAAVLLWFSYNLLVKIIENPNENHSLVRMQFKTIKFFMLMSLVVITVGLSWEMLNPKVTIRLSAIPNNDNLIIKIANKAIKLNEDNSYVVNKDENDIIIDATGLNKILDNVKKDLKSKTEVNIEKRNEIAKRMIEEGLEK